MAELFAVADLVKVAVEDEKSGVAFYTALAGRAAGAALRETFATMAAQERGHQKRFEEMLTALGGYKTGEGYEGEYVAYLQALTGSRAFPDEAGAAAAAKGCRDDRAAIELAIRFERDTVLLMREMSALLPEGHRGVVDELVREEQGHLIQLAHARAGRKI